MYYSDQVIEDVRSANNIVEVISARVKLAKKGKYYFGLCPFHSEKTPSFSVDPDRQYYYCYSCSKGGDVYKFIIETEKITFPEAIQRLADRVHMQLPESSDPVYNQKIARAKELRERHLTMHALAAAFFSQSLFGDAGKQARAYMQKRAIRSDMVSRFGLGYARPEWESLYQCLREKGYGDDEQLAGGLILKKNGGGHYDRFRDRIIFPISDESGRVLAFGGRALDDTMPKYMNSPETPIYSKGKVLYGLHLAKQTKEKYIVLVEGYMDLISLSAHGIDNVVAPLGTALTEVQARLLKRYTDDAVIAFDADTAGEAASLRGLDILVSHGFRVRVITIPGYKDPDEFVGAKGAAAFRGLVASAEPLTEYKISSIRKKIPGDAPDSDVRFFKEAVRVLADVGDAVERDIYINRIAAQYRITEGAIRAEIEKITSGSSNRSANNGAGSRTNSSMYNRTNSSLNDRTNNSLNNRTNNNLIAQNVRTNRNRYAAPPAPSTGATRPAPPAMALQPTPQAGTMQPSQSARIPAAGAPINDPSAVSPQGIDTDEFFVAALLSIDNSLWDIASEKLPPDHIENPNVRQAVIYTCERASKGFAVSPGELMHFFPAEESDCFAGIITSGCHCEDNRRAMLQKIKDIHAARAKRHMRDILRELETGGLSEPDIARLKLRLSEHMKNAAPAAGGSILSGEAANNSTTVSGAAGAVR